MPLLHTLPGKGASGQDVPSQKKVWGRLNWFTVKPGSLYKLLAGKIITNIRKKTILNENNRKFILFKV